MVNMLIKKIITCVYRSKKIYKNRVLFESNAAYDNAYTLFMYAVKNRPDLESYFYCPDFFLNGKHIEKRIYKYSHNKKGRLGQFIARARIQGFAYGCETIFSSFHIIKPDNPKTIYVFLNHGYGVKAAKKFANGVLSSGCDIVLPSAKCCGMWRKTYLFNNNKVVISPSPRIDELKHDKNKENAFNELIHKKSGEKTIIVMITFRRNQNNSFNKDFIFPSFIKLDDINFYLKQNNIKLIIKFHHTFDNIDTSSMNGYENIICLKNKDLFALGLNPTSFLVYSDACITDYSSVTSDYVLLGKPMGFLIDKEEKFFDGFIVDDPLSFLPGNIIRNNDDFKHFINDIKTDNDSFASDRKKVALIFSGTTKTTFDASKRVLNIYYPEKGFSET